MADKRNKFEIPDEWRTTEITALFKNKGTHSDCSNYRGLSIGNSLLKLCMAVILNRIRPWYSGQLLPNQVGFRANHGCGNAIFNYKQLHNLAARQETDRFVLFVDLMAAYDWLCRKWLFSSIYNRIDVDNIRNSICIMECLYQHTRSKMSDGEDIFTTTCGVRQGGSETPVLFNLYGLHYENLCLGAKKTGIGVEVRYRISAMASTRAQRSKPLGGWCMPVIWCFMRRTLKIYRKRWIYCVHCCPDLG